MVYAMLKFHIITLFPEFFKVPLDTGILGRSIKRNLLKVNFIQLRNFAKGAYQSVDDEPFGGGDGMVLQYEPLKQAIKSAPKGGAVYYLSPKGKQWNYEIARKWAENDQREHTIICGRYGGIDQRIIAECVDEEISIGDYVLTGGEPAALLILDSLCRFIKGTLGNELSATNESFEEYQLLECPQWTRPREIKGHHIPKVLFSGHHQHIKKFRYFISILLTALKRPDLLATSPAKKDVPAAIKYAQQLSDEELTACGLHRTDLHRLSNPS